ncbi:MAG: hypothetical protein K6G55_06655 [Selenomonadaceae bacterium]|nr:hypothetical protein [Selenomonadaceae bacterium]
MTDSRKYQQVSSVISAFVTINEKMRDFILNFIKNIVPLYSVTKDDDKQSAQTKASKLSQNQRRRK